MFDLSVIGAYTAAMSSTLWLLEIRVPIGVARTPHRINVSETNTPSLYPRGSFTAATLLKDLQSRRRTG